MEMMDRVLREGRQVIVLIPEIALTYQTVMRFYKRFGGRIAILNSRLSAGERYDQWELAMKGGVDIMIGPRSALFAPFSNLGLIVIDEEHEGAYKARPCPGTMPGRRRGSEPGCRERMWCWVLPPLLWNPTAEPCPENMGFCAFRKGPPQTAAWPRRKWWI